MIFVFDRLGAHHARPFRGGGRMTDDYRVETLSLLERLGLAYVVVDEPKGFRSSTPPVVPATSPLAVIRFHGHNAETYEKPNVSAAERFRYLYSEEELKGWVAPVRRLAGHHDDATIAGVLARQGRRTGTGLAFTQNRVADLRHAPGIPAAARKNVTPAGQGDDVVSSTRAAAELGVGVSAIYRWIADGFIPGEQAEPGAPWRIRLTSELRAKVTGPAPDGWLPLNQAAAALGVARQTVLQKVQRGELAAVHVRHGRRSGLRIQVTPDQSGLFEKP